MKHLVLTLLSLFIFNNVIAEVTDSRPQVQPEPDVIRPRMRPKGLVTVLPEVVGDFGLQASTQLDIDSDYKMLIPTTTNGFRENCVGGDQYFQADGRLGSKGRRLKSEFLGNGRSTPMKHLYFRSGFPGMRKLCPRFDRFDDDVKLNFWIWYMAATARIESHCGRNAYNPNDPNGTSAGELQLHESYSKGRKWRGLNEDHRKVEKAGKGCWATEEKEVPKSRTHRRPPALYMGNISNNISCGVEILSGVLCGYYIRKKTRECMSNTRKPYGHGFWKQIRRGINGKIPKLIKEFPACTKEIKKEKFEPRSYI